jgi:predicted nucleotidyltransferase
MLPAALTLPPALPAFLDALVEEAQPSRVVLFGSHARGEAREDSDVDLLVILTESTDPLREAQRLYRTLDFSRLDADLVVATEEQIERLGSRVGLIYHEALAEGLTVYAA